MDVIDLIRAKLFGGGEGGGSTITVEPLYVSENGEYTAEEGYAYDPVTVDVSPALQTKTVTADIDEQTVLPDSGYDGLSSVTVEAMPNIWSGTQAQYDALSTYDSNTLYVIIG